VPQHERNAKRLSEALDKIGDGYSKAEEQLVELQKEVDELREAMDENDGPWL
jgi:uncharacterized coiled-coil DUF342 family protein